MMTISPALLLVCCVMQEGEMVEESVSCTKNQEDTSLQVS